MEKTVKHFCTTASRIKKDAVRSVKAANIAIGISAMVHNQRDIKAEEYIKIYH